MLKTLTCDAQQDSPKRLPGIVPIPQEICEPVVGGKGLEHRGVILEDVDPSHGEVEGEPYQDNWGKAFADQAGAKLLD